MIIILTDADEAAVLDRLLSSQTHVCSCQPTHVPDAPHEAEPRGPRESWSSEELSAIAGCKTLPQARRAYRAAFPTSNRTDGAIKGALRAMRKVATPDAGSDAITTDLRDECSAGQQEAEEEQTSESAAPADSAIAAEMEGLYPTLAGLQDEIPIIDEQTGKIVCWTRGSEVRKPAPETESPPPRECTGEEITLYAGKETALSDKAVDAIAAVASGWQDEEDKLIAPALSSISALGAYRERFPQSARTDDSIKSRWYVLQPPMLPLKTKVRILQKHTPFSEKIGTIARRNIQTREYQVIPDESSSRIWFSEDKVEPVEDVRS